jgi:hypothetical protein
MLLFELKPLSIKISLYFVIYDQYVTTSLWILSQILVQCSLHTSQVFPKYIQDTIGHYSNPLSNTVPFLSVDEKEPLLIRFDVNFRVDTDYIYISTESLTFYLSNQEFGDLCITKSFITRTPGQIS